MRLAQKIEALHAAATIADLKATYESSCREHEGDAAALWAIREAAFYAKCRLEGIDPELVAA